jgi:hypothetical protein
MLCHVICWICIDISEDPATSTILVNEDVESRILQMSVGFYQIMFQKTYLWVKFMVLMKD